MQRLVMIILMLLCNMLYASQGLIDLNERARERAKLCIEQKKKADFLERINKEIKSTYRKPQFWPQARDYITTVIKISNVHPDKIKYRQMTPLLAAIINDDQKEDYIFADFLLKNGADSDSYFKTESIFFHIKSLSMAKLIYQYRKKAGTGKPLSQLRTSKLLNENLLHVAQLKADPALTTFYINLGVDVNACDARGYTPLMTFVSCVSRYKDMTHIKQQLKALINGGAIADLEGVDSKNNKTPHAIALLEKWQQEHHAIVLLEKALQNSVVKKSSVSKKKSHAEMQYDFYTDVLSALHTTVQAFKKSQEKENEITRSIFLTACQKLHTVQ